MVTDFFHHISVYSMYRSAQCKFKWFISSEMVTWLDIFTIKRDLFTVLWCFLPIYNKEQLIGWHPSGVARTWIQVIEANFREILIKGKDIQFELAGCSSGFYCTLNHVAFVGVHPYSYWVNNKPCKVLGGL